MTRLPWMKFHKSDWLGEPSLKLCSRAARSLWLDMLCLMHDAQPCGHLALHGQKLDARALGVLLGDRPRTIERLLGELEQARVFDRLADGTIVCRRMLREVDRAERDRRNGQSGGNPALRRAERVNPGLKAQTQDARRHRADQDQDPPDDGREQEPDLPEFPEKDLGEFAVTGAAASGSPSTTQVAAPAATPARLKRPERADQHLAEHMIGQGMDGAQVWSLIGAARDPGHVEHGDAARQCEAYSQRFRLGWFADERQWAPPALNVVAGGRRR